MGLLLALLSALLWSALDALRKRLAGAVDPAALALALCLGQALVFGGWAAATGAEWGDPTYFGVAAVNGVINASASLLFLIALRVAPLSETIPLLALTPALTALIAGPLLGEWPTPLGTLGIAAVVGGAFTLARAGAVGRLRLRRGGALMMVVAALWAIAGPLDKVALARADLPFHAAFLSLVAGATLAAMMATRGELRALAGVAARGREVAAAIGVIAGAQAAQFVAFTLVQVSAVETIKRALGMVMAVALGRIVFKEAITGRKAAAIAAMLAGTLLLVYG